jgi:hypothetical protein
MTSQTPKTSFSYQTTVTQKSAPIGLTQNVLTPQRSQSSINICARQPRYTSGYSGHLLSVCCGKNDTKTSFNLSIPAVHFLQFIDHSGFSSIQHSPATRAMIPSINIRDDSPTNKPAYKSKNISQMWGMDEGGRIPY